MNDLSFHGQFADPAEFRSAIRVAMSIRQLVQRYGGDLSCHRKIANAQVTPRMCMLQVVQHLKREEKQALMQWLTRIGPFWEDDSVRLHSPDDYLECRDDVVTDSAVGEAAYCEAQGVPRSLVSLSPSKWEFTPAVVEWISDTGPKPKTEVANFWQQDSVKLALESAPAPIDSWAHLEALCVRKFLCLTFLPKAFEPLRGCPFSKAAALRIVDLMGVLDSLKGSFDAEGTRTKQGQEIYQNYFTGDRSWFSDSSDVEKLKFGREMTFSIPNKKDDRILCTMHGKVNSPKHRVHFSWPVRSDDPLYVAYVGPKITKR